MSDVVSRAGVKANVSGGYYGYSVHVGTLGLARSQWQAVLELQVGQP